MSIALIAVTLVLVLSHALPGLAAWRRPAAAWQALRALGVRLGLRRLDGIGGVLLLLLPVLLLGLLQLWLGARWWGVLLLPYGVAMLYFCWGPRDLDRDVQALVAAEDAEARRRARSALGLAADDERSASAVAAVFRAGLARWFGPLFWFVLLGGAGAALYRLARESASEASARQAPLARLRAWLDWPVAQLMSLGLAVVANFDAVLAAWRQWHQRTPRAAWADEPGYLDAAAQASVVCDLIEEAEEAAPDDAPLPTPDSLGPTPLQTALDDALSLLRRVLIAWMVVLAVLLLGGMAG
jgi:AmpE protein